MSNRAIAGRVQPDIARLVVGAQAGDREAFGELVRLHENEVFTLAVRLVGDRELAADVAQETFVRAWRALPRFRGDAKLSTWLHRITVNTAWSAQRRWRRHPTLALDEVGHAVVDQGIGPEQAGVDVDLADRLQAALLQLAPSMRSVVVLKDVYDWPHAAIARELGISVTAAKVRLHRGRKVLRELLAPELHMP